jgi:hypothetical protein
LTTIALGAGLFDQLLRELFLRPLPTISSSRRHVIGHVGPSQPSKPLSLSGRRSYTEEPTLPLWSIR